MTQPSWAEDQAAQIAAEVRRLRGKRSAQWLSDRTAELGHTVTRSVITDLENGRRKYVTIAELIVLAAALNTYPIALLYPPPYGEPVRILPSVPAGRPERLSAGLPKHDAVEWFSGSEPTAEAVHRVVVGGDKNELKENVQAFRAAGEIPSLERQLAQSSAHYADRFTQYGADDPVAGALFEQIEFLRGHLDDLRETAGIDSDGG
ncbi:MULTISPECIES: helix-turn-helix domain-containing protein [unclassified Mycobacterium]|uniref:helix-turn-helix domain-containing protein n=1 Tax=unclassified Mycobacterium TaxID=2642494 RepID=UPI0009922330|nr:MULTISPECIES: helix-turn-helix domain-containing protein [unclassified Mycobacterium]